MQAYYDEFDDPYDILKMMLNYVDNDAGTCLHLASKVNDLLKMIIAKTCCVESVSWSYTKSPYFLHIFFSMQLGYSDVVRALLAAGSDPTITNKEGATAFDYCTSKEILGVYNEELLQAAANSK